jgi:hypothetical protein
MPTLMTFVTMWMTVWVAGIAVMCVTVLELATSVDVLISQMELATVMATY